MDKLFGSPSNNQNQQPQQTQAQTQQQSTGPGNIPANGGVSDPSNPTLPAGTVDTSKANDPSANPLDAFKDIWKPAEPNKDAAPTNSFANIDPAKIMEAAGKVNFTQSITPELMQKINAGGEGAMQAMLEAMNKVGQASFAQAMQASIAINNRSLAEARQQFSSELPGMFKRQALSDSLRTENPAFSHPAAQPILEALQTQLTQKYPNATSGELAQMARDYLANFNAAANPTKESSAQQQSQQSTEPDWEKFMGL